MAITYRAWMKSMALRAITCVLFTAAGMWALTVSAQDAKAKPVSLDTSPVASSSNASGDHWSTSVPAPTVDYRQPLTGSARLDASSLVSRAVPSASVGGTSLPSALPAFQPAGPSKLEQVSTGALAFVAKSALVMAVEKTGSRVAGTPPGQLPMPDRSNMAVNCQASQYQGAYASCPSR
jgi:hypothetical protein